MAVQHDAADAYAGEIQGLSACTGHRRLLGSAWRRKRTVPEVGETRWPTENPFATEKKEKKEAIQGDQRFDAFLTHHPLPNVNI